MKFNTLAGRAAAAGAASALVAGALVGTVSTAALAAPVDNTYTCHGTTDFPVQMTGGSGTLDALPGAEAGLDVPPGLLQDLTLTFTVPNAVLALLPTLERVEASDFAASIDTTDVPVNGLGAEVGALHDNGDGTSSFTATGVNGAFEVPAAGTYDVISPSTFNIQAFSTGATTPVTIPCEIAGTPGVWRADFPVTKNASTTTAKAPKKAVKKGKAAAVTVKVTADNQRPTGKVVLKKGKKTVAKGDLNKKGKAVLKVKKGLKVGKNKLVALYKGDGYTKKSKSKAVTVKVKR